MSEQADSKGNSPTAHGARTRKKGAGGKGSKRPSRGWQALAGAWPLVIFGLVWFYNLDISPRIRTLILVGLIVVIVLGVLIALAWAKRYLTSVARVTTFVLLVLVVAAAALIPAVFLDPSGRIVVLKLGAILFLSLFPGLLYLQFIALRRESLRDEYVINLHRLNMDTYENLPRPPVGSIWYRPGDPRPEYQANNIYQRKFDAAYGEPVKGRQVSLGGSWGSNLRPILLSTVLLAVGWALVVQPEEIGSAAFGGLTLSGRPVLPTDALRFGFAGAYLFILEMLIRRFFQDDLKTGAFISASARILAVMLLVTAVHQIWPASLDAGQENAFAFLIGVFPQLGLKALQNLAAKPLRGLIPSLQQDYPLSDLDGLNIWYESRLLEEGIEDMQNLATANLVDAMLRTRVPVDRLVDWVDQTLLFLRVSKKSPGKDDQENDLPSDRGKLRRLGIRTATDMEDAFRHPVLYQDDGKLEKKQIPKPEDFDRRLLGALNKEDDGLPSFTLGILRSLAREPNLHHVRQWKAFPKELVLVNRARAKADQGALVTGSSRPTSAALAAVAPAPEANGPTAR
jgi:hypothetical protein